MNKKITGITIKLHQDTEVTITLEEARKLYNELKDIFDTKLTFPNYHVYPYSIPRSPPQWIDDVTCKTNTNTVDPSTYKSLHKERT